MAQHYSSNSIEQKIQLLRLTTNDTFFTDLFRKNHILPVKYTFVTYSPVDRQLFSQFSTIGPTIHVNPPMQTLNALYTLPTITNPTQRMIVGRINQLYVDAQSHETEIELDNDGPFTYNSKYCPADNFKLLLQHLYEQPVHIDELFYTKIACYIKTYSELVFAINCIFDDSIKMNHVGNYFTKDVESIKYILGF